MQDTATISATVVPVLSDQERELVELLAAVVVESITENKFPKS